MSFVTRHWSLVTLSLDGLLVIDKPEGPTSHDVVARVRRALGERRAGHTGTLDPMATGVLPVLLGRATRIAQFLSGSTKRYVATVRLGFATTTFDHDGEQVGERVEASGVSTACIDQALASFRGTVRQMPPRFSAKKLRGTSAHVLARRGVHADLKPIVVTVHDLTLVDRTGDRFVIDLRCSAGFYVRSLAHDLGVMLGCGAHLAALRRTASGEVTLAEAVTLDWIERNPEAARERVTPPSRLLPAVPAVRLTAIGLIRARHGAMLGPEDCEDWDAALLRASWPTVEASMADRPIGEATRPERQIVRILGPDGELVAIGRWIHGAAQVKTPIENAVENPSPETRGEEHAIAPSALHPRVVLFYD
jgi:tRNA pseudouridine55 synthase